MLYLAHLRQEASETALQTIEDHLRASARLAQRFGEAFGSGPQAAYCASLHDIGKYSDAFQSRIRGSGVRTDHSTAGAQQAAQLPGMGKLFAYCIAGHHGGLPSGGDNSDTQAEATLCGRLKRKVEAYDAFLAQHSLPPRPPVPPLKPLGKYGFTLSFYTRMLYSCVVDADFLDTESFMHGSAGRGGFESLSALARKLEIRLAGFDQAKEGAAGKSKEINGKRSEILRECIDAAQLARGLYSLTVPTGGGKTFSSLAFALWHALKNGMDRVIYVIPYTSIIEQNAEEFAKCLGAQNVLQHHSNFNFSAEDDEGILHRQKLAAENWDAPLIVTTNVQFFESLFAHKPSRCRKLHNIANSVIIFDEAQMFPTPFLQPCIRAISELVYNYQCTAVLCSATQPVLQFPKETPIREICRDAAALYPCFKRTRMVYRGVLSDEPLSQELSEQQQALCIVNTRKHARALYRMIAGGGAFHLSTLMCPKHREEVISEIKRRLLAGEPCRVIATRLIEAGVDVDFPVVYRALAGVDSLVQSAGRCNREGKRPLCDVHVFIPEDEDFQRLPHSMRRPIEVARGILPRFPDLLAPDAIRAYFEELYSAQGQKGLDMQAIVQQLESGAQDMAFDFPEIAREFRLIDCESVPVLIPFGEGGKWISILREKGPDRELMRALQPFTVSVYPNEVQALDSAGMLEHVWETAVLVQEEQYDAHIGLSIPEGAGYGILF